MVAVYVSSLRWSVLRWAREERSACSGGENIEVGVVWEAVRSGEG